jgi:hypothetical protein
MPDDRSVSRSPRSRSDRQAILAGWRSRSDGQQWPAIDAGLRRSQALKVLERAGLITRGRNAQYRPCRLESAPLDGAIDWIEKNRKVWTDRFTQLEEHIRKIQRAQEEDQR